MAGKKTVKMPSKPSGKKGTPGLMVMIPGMGMPGMSSMGGGKGKPSPKGKGKKGK